MFSTVSTLLRKRKMEEVSSKLTKSTMDKWNECQGFFEKHHPTRAIMHTLLKLIHNDIISHFYRVMQCRRKQVTLD